MKWDERKILGDGEDEEDSLDGKKEETGKDAGKEGNEGEEWKRVK